MGDMEITTSPTERVAGARALRGFLAIVNAERADLTGERAQEAELLAAALEDFATRVERGDVLI